MPLLKTDGSEMMLQEIYDALTVAAQGGSKPVDVGCSAWVDVCKRVYDEAHEAERVLRNRINAMRRELTVQCRKRQDMRRQYETAKTSTVGSEPPFPAKPNL